MSSELEFNLQEVKWAEVRDEIYKINPELVQQCDQVNIYNQYSLFKIWYPYGSTIVNEGDFGLPTVDGKIVSIKNPLVPESLREQLSYSPIPLSLIINNSSEVFVNIQKRVIPLNFLTVGELFGLFEIMNIWMQKPALPPPIWNVTAGARSVFMLPSISDMIGHNRIQKKFGTNINVPYDLSDHWQTFVDINTCSEQKPDWHTTIIVFTRKWLQPSNNIGYIKYMQYLAIQGWQQLQFRLLGDLTEFSVLWSFFTHEINNRNLKSRPYLIDTIKHLILIAKGSGVAFAPSTDNIALPRDVIQQVYIDHYNLKDYIPTIMQPATFTNSNNKLYYSLSFPTLPNSSPYFRNPPSIIEDQREIQKLLTILLNVISKIRHPSTQMLQHIKFKMFHSGNDPFGQIIVSNQIAKSDSRFLSYSNIKTEKRIFCSFSTFFNGCISIEYDDDTP